MFHQPVLLTEVLQMWKIKPNGVYVDCTVGHGGHSLGLIQQLNHQATLIIIDQDQANLQIAKHRLTKFTGRLIVCYGNFANLHQILTEHNILIVDGFLYDLGVATSHFSETERGFSYQTAGPLDMRMDRQQILTAAQIVNHYSLTELVRLFKQYGEEPFAHPIAQAICHSRVNQPIETTDQLVKVIKTALPDVILRKKGHPARLVFQALRIAVNNELAALKLSLAQTKAFCQAHSRVLVITFHSLEDRIVKQFFRTVPSARLVTKKPILPQLAEITTNYRARSAKLRVLEYVS